MKSIDAKTLPPQKILVLDNIRSAQNVGSLFRTADAAGIDLIYLVGVTPTPIDRFDRKNTALSKTALGAENTVPWKHVTSMTRLLTLFKTQGIQTIAIEQSERAVDYKKVKVVFPVAFIVGNEVDGIAKKALEKIDTIAEIPMKGGKESLNVAVAGGIALFRMLNI